MSYAVSNFYSVMVVSFKQVKRYERFGVGCREVTCARKTVDRKLLHGKTQRVGCVYTRMGPLKSGLDDKASFTQAAPGPTGAPLLEGQARVANDIIGHE